MRCFYSYTLKTFSQEIKKVFSLLVCVCVCAALILCRERHQNDSGLFNHNSGIHAQPISRTAMRQEWERDDDRAQSNTPPRGRESLCIQHQLFKKKHTKSCHLKCVDTDFELDCVTASTGKCSKLMDLNKKTETRMSVGLMVHVNHIQWKHQQSGKNMNCV